jgi:competence protein ComEC
MDASIKPRRVLNRRPLVLLAVCFAIGVVMGRFVPSVIVYGIAAAVAAVAAFCLFLLKHARPVMVLAGAVCALLAACMASAAMLSPAVATGEGLTVTGHIYSEPYENDYGSIVYLLDDAQVNGEPSGNVKLYVPAELNAGLACGDMVMAKAEVELPRGVRNPGGFDDRLYLLTQGVHYKAYAESVEKVGDEASFSVTMAATRRYIGGVIDRVFEPDVAPVAKGLLIGDVRGIDDEAQQDFRDTGMTHVLSVSGLHAAILIAAIYAFFRIIRLGRTPRLVAAMVFIAGYTFIAGMVPSMVRAGVMASAVLLHKHFGRQNDTLNGLALAFIASLLINPLDMFTAGFQLSFGAVFGMLTLGWQMRRWLAKRVPRRLSWLNESASASVGATAGTLPVLAASFNRVSIFSIFLNLFLIPLSSAIIVLVFICTLMGVAFAPAAAVVAYMPTVLIRLLMSAIGWAADIPFMAVNVASPPWYIVLACYGLLFIVSKYLLVRVRVKTSAGACVSFLALSVLLLSCPAGMYLAFLDVGQGDAAYLRTARGEEYFIDGGRPESAEEVVDFAVRCGISPEAAFVSHTDDDHFAGITALYQAGLLYRVFCSYQEEEKVAAAMPGAEVVPLAAGDVVLLDDETRAVVLYPYKDTAAESTNESSLVLLVEYNDHTALFTGDINGQTETSILTDIGPVDIYKAAHHGSKYSSYRLPLSALSPEYSVISVGANSFGQPHKWAMHNLEDYSDEVYITRDDYAVEFYINDDIKVNTYGGRHNET